VYNDLEVSQHWVKMRNFVSERWIDLREATDLAATWKEHQQTQDGAYRNDLERAIDSHLTVLADYRRMYAAARRLP
jgi:hypothetical protein